MLKVGSDVSLFKEGDKVFYAGDMTKNGCFSKYQNVDERIVGHMPKSLNFEQAASLPLASLTAYEGLFEQLKIEKASSILVINGAGGVGSMVIQIAKHFGLTVIATASKESSIKWVKKQGADIVINHKRNLKEELLIHGLKDVGYIFCNHSIDEYFDIMSELISVNGRIVSIVNSKYPLDMSKLFYKKITFSWEFMFAKSMFQTDDLESQHRILNLVSDLIDNKKINHILNSFRGDLSPESLTNGLKDLASGNNVGKTSYSVQL